MSRLTLVADIVQELREGATQGVFIVGQHGVGKTWVVGQVLAALGADTTVIRLSPSAALSHVQFGAVNARIGATDQRLDDFHSVLLGLERQIQQDLAEAPVVLVVDNAAHLDGQSAAVIAQALLDTGAKLILSDLPGSAGDALHQLWRDGGLRRFEVDPLAAGEVQALMEGLLEGRVAGAAASYLWQRSNGNAGVVKGLVAGALEDGTLREIAGTWALDHPADHLGAESRDFLRMDLAQISPASKRIVDILALAGPLPLDALLQLCTADELDEVQQSEIAVITLGREVKVELARPAFSAAIRELVPVGRSRGLRAEVSTVFDPHALGLHDSIITDVLWQLDCGLAIDDHVLVNAATLANRALRTPDALRISKLITHGPHLASALAQQSLASYHASQLSAARDLATRSLSLAADSATAAQALEAWCWAFAPEEDFGERFAGALSAYHGQFGDTSAEDDAGSPGFRVEELRALAELSLGDLEHTHRRLDALLANPTLVDVGTTVQLKGMLCEVLAGSGRAAEASSLAVEILAALDQEPFSRPDISVLAYARASAAMIYYGDWESATELLETAISVHHNLILPSRGLRHLGLAMMYIRMGRVEEALAQMRPCLDALVEHDPWLVLPVALGLGAYASALRGDVDQARARLAQLDGLRRRGAAMYALEGRAYAIAASSTIGDTSSGIDELAEIRANCQAHGYATIEFTVAMLMIRMGGGAVLGRLQELAEVVQSRHRDFYVAYGQAMASQKGEMLQDASTMATMQGFDLIAAELAATAQERFSESGQQQKSRKAAAMLLTLRDRLPGIASQAFGSADHPELTRREAEIAKFVAAGLSNNDIATRLHVSLRTVEGHLYRTFIKLDIKSREELAHMARALESAGTTE
ncbi:LuxR C-terminal-related transcriptional regulator [Pseudarthrobacter sp. P1]|uniref:helix-turn-helix transcriptional regulator n=1 Tax=Pseudarthrobacter sp. P1 TaxID=3418418 RepID=UPI003CF8EF4F